MMIQNPNERQVGGTHYAAEFQHWDLVWRLRVGYFAGQITKYTSRWRKKNGAQDLEKARHFAEKYKLLLEDSQTSVIEPKVALGDIHNSLRRYFAENPHLGQLERDICSILCYAHDAAGLHNVLLRLAALLDEAHASTQGGATSAYVDQ